MADTLLFFRKDIDQALAEAKAAQAAAPYDADMLGDLSNILLFAGETDEAMEWLNEAMRRNPKSWYHNNLGWGYLMKGEYQTALEELAKCNADCSPFYNSWLQLSAYYRLGRMDDARAAADVMRKERPDFTVTKARDEEEYYKNPVNTERELEELRKMGFPET